MLESPFEVELNKEFKLSLFHYDERKEMQFDISDNSFSTHIPCININLEEAKVIRDRLDAFIRYHDK